MHIKIPNIFTFISRFKKEEILNFDKKIGIIFRNYKNRYNKDEIIKLKQFCNLNNRKIYLANDIKLAINLNLSGAYVPSFNKELAIRRYSFKKNFTLLGSAHNIFEIKTKENQGIEVLFLSPLFITKNYKHELGIFKFNTLSKFYKKKIIALGGINERNIRSLKNTNAYGFSGITYFKNKFKK